MRQFSRPNAQLKKGQNDLLGAGRGQGSESAGRDDEDHYIVMTVVVMVVVVVLPNLCLEILEKHEKGSKTVVFIVVKSLLSAIWRVNEFVMHFLQCWKMGCRTKTFEELHQALRNADLVGASDPQCIVRVILLNGEVRLLVLQKPSSRLHFLCVHHAVGEKIEMMVHCWF